MYMLMAVLIFAALAFWLGCRLLPRVSSPQLGAVIAAETEAMQPDDVRIPAEIRARLRHFNPPVTAVFEEKTQQGLEWYLYDAEGALIEVLYLD